MQNVYQVLSGYMNFNQGYQVPSMMEQAGLTVKRADMYIERVQGGSIHGEHMSIAVTRLVPYLKNMPDHAELFPKLLDGFMNPDLHWYAHTRTFAQVTV